VAVEVESNLDGTVVQTLPVLPEHRQVDSDFMNSWMQCVRVTSWSVKVVPYLTLTDLRRFDRALNRSQVFLLAKPLM
jgi:hypothetical protein